RSRGEPPADDEVAYAAEGLLGERIPRCALPRGGTRRHTLRPPALSVCALLVCALLVCVLAVCTVARNRVDGIRIVALGHLLTWLTGVVHKLGCNIVTIL